MALDELEPSKRLLLEMYAIKRRYLFLDEWGFYLIMCMMYVLNIPITWIYLVMIYGGLAIITSYKNIELIENAIFDGRCTGWLLWPIMR